MAGENQVSLAHTERSHPGSPTVTRQFFAIALPAATVFLGALLLFIVQPMVAKTLLPEFGGSPSVWLVCLLYFQTMVFAGYCYAHGLRLIDRPAVQVKVHVVLVGFGLLWMGVAPFEAASVMQQVNNETARLLGQLLYQTGPPVILLASTSVLVQHWLGAEDSPYRLYTVSNLGSLLALVGYTILLEPNSDLLHQWQLWLGAYLLFLCLAAGLVGLVRNQAPAGSTDTPFQISNVDRLYWVTLSALGCMVLLACSGILTRDIAPIPLLWILPLGIYLTTFIICFNSTDGYKRHWYLPLFFLSLLGYTLVDRYSVDVSLEVRVLLLCALLFSACMLCHGELVRRTPPKIRLTEFYVLMSLGGIAGSLFVNVAAPLLFSDYHENAITLVLVLALAFILATRELQKRFAVIRDRRWRIGTVATSAFLAPLLFYGIIQETRQAIASVRNFNGTNQVYEVHGSTPFAHRVLLNDSVRHGTQFQDKEFSRQSKDYYSPDSGVGLLLGSQKVQAPRDIAVIGLGVGSLAAYGQAQDTFYFYEINPAVIGLAATYFSFLQDSPATINVIEGDARQSLQAALSSGLRFDVIVVDAFSGHTVPAHLLTRESWRLYQHLLKPQGAIAVHQTNRYLDLTPIIQGHHKTEPFGSLYKIVNQADPDWLIDAATWMIATNDEDVARVLTNQQPGNDSIKVAERVVHWTDQRSSMIGLFR